MDSFTRSGLTFDVRDGAPAAETGADPASGPEAVLLLHGFPQTSASWGPVASRLHAAGLRTLAPDQRGYSPRARPRGRRAYRVDELVADAATLIEVSGEGSVHVVGHDWGAVVAWALAAARPDLVRTVTGVSVPHPGAFLRAMATSSQGLHSWYMGFFQLPAVPEALLADPGRMAAVLRRTGQSREHAERDAAALAGRLTGPLNWYRALPFASPGASTTPVQRPSLMVWSDGDGFITRAAAEGNAAHVRAPHRLEVLEGVSHWIPDEAPDRLADLVLAHVRRPAA